MKQKVLFAGIDGTGKTTCLYALLDRMDPAWRVLKIGFSGTYLVHGGERRRLVSQALQERIEAIGEGSRRFRLYGVFLIFNFLWKYALSKYLQLSQRADVVMFETDTLLHPAVYLTHHFAFARKIPPRWRFRVVSWLFGRRRGTLILYLEADPAVSVERVERREREKGIPVEPHENLRDLSALKLEFERMVAAAVAAGYRVVRIDTTHRSSDEVTALAQQALASALGGRLPQSTPSPDLLT
jgi:thymidylate kinase